MPVSLLAQSPTITGLSPASAVQGQAVTLTISGTGFCFFSQVTFNGQSVSSSFNNTNQLVVNIGAGVTSSLLGPVPVRVNNSVGFSGCPVPGLSNAFDFNVTRPPLVVSTNSPLPDGTVNVNYGQFITVSSGVSPYHFEVSPDGQFPPGLTLNPNTGLLSGTPTQAGTYLFSVIVSDFADQTVVRNYSLTVRQSSNPLTISTNALPNAAVNTSYTSQLAGTGGTAPYTWSILSGAPTGLTINASSGILSGTPSQAGSFNVQFRLADAANNSVTKTILLVVQSAALQLTTTSLPLGTVGVGYSASVTASGGTPGYNFTTNSTLPTGLTLATNGLIAGTPQQAGTFSIAVLVRDSVGQSVTGNLTLVIQSPQLQITTSFLPPANAGVAYTTTIAASGGSTPYTFTTSSPLPLGFSLLANGTLTGTTQQTGSFPLTIVVRDAQNQTASANLGLTVGTTLQITTTSIPVASIAQAYSTTISATGGTTPYQWFAPNGLPSGFTLNPTSGILSGTPLVEGSFAFNIQVVDAAQQTSLRAFTLIVGNALTITNTGLKNGIVATPYEEIFTATGGVPPYNWTALVAPPPGLTLNPTTGVLNGAPTLNGNFNVTVRVTDVNGASATRSYSLTIAPSFRITTTAINSPTLGVFFEQLLTAEGGTAPYFWAYTGTPLPGLVLNNTTGALNGTPTAGGVFNITVFASDSTGLQTSRAFTVTINQTIRIGPDAIAAATVGTSYSQTFTASGGSAPYAFSSLNLVPGLVLDTAGVLSGTPTQAGTFEMVIRATDIAQQQGVRTYTITVQSNLTITTASLPDGTERVAYSQALGATGGTNPITWRVSAGTLPEGISLSTAGLLSGTPVRAGTSAFTVEATDASSLKGTKALSITILPGLSLTSATLPNGIVGGQYSASVTANGGSAPYRFRVASGLLPDGLALAETGQITGTPARAGRFTTAIEVTDSLSRTATGDITININPTLLRFTSSETLPNATAGVNYQFSPAATGGTPPYRWALVQGPAELSINETTGAITGRLVNPGNLSFTIRVTDANQVVASQAVVLRVVLPATPSVNITGLPANGTPGAQLTPGVSISQAFPIALAGELTLTFNSAVNVDDPAIQFAAGGRRLAFTIPAGQTAASFSASSVGIQTGTVAGTIVVTARLTAAGNDVTPNPAPSFSITIPRSAPVINSLRLNRTGAGFELVIVAYATGRELTSAAVRLTTSGTVQGTEFTVNLAGVTGPWYQGANSAQFGSLCAITIPFTVQQGTSGNITSVAVTLTNATGSSASSTVNY